MDALIALLNQTLFQVWITFTHNWPFLIASILVAVILKLYLDPGKVGDFLIRHRRAGVIGATAAAVATPLCSCGTTAVILGMMASMIPWAPIIAFMVASPLTSPEELVYSAGLFGWPFALAFFTASILLGLFGGLVGGIFENRGWLKNQARYADAPEKAAAPTRPGACGCSAQPGPSPLPACGCETRPPRQPAVLSRVRPPTHQVAQPAAACCSPAGLALAVEPAAFTPVLSAQPTACACETAVAQPAHPPLPVSLAGGAKQITPRIFLTEALQTGKRLLPMFLGFAFIGYFINGLIPAAWVSAIFGPGHAYSVPLAAALGLPLYLNTEASLPLVRALIDGGMSQGAALAFLITGAGTSTGAVMGALTIARWRVIALVVGILWVGAVAAGFGYDILLAAGLI